MEGDGFAPGMAGPGDERIEVRLSVERKRHRSQKHRKGDVVEWGLAILARHIPGLAKGLQVRDRPGKGTIELNVSNVAKVSRLVRRFPHRLEEIVASSDDEIGEKNCAQGQTLQPGHCERGGVTLIEGRARGKTYNISTLYRIVNSRFAPIPFGIHFALLSFCKLRYVDASLSEVAAPFLARTRNSEDSAVESTFRNCWFFNLDAPRES